MNTAVQGRAKADGGYNAADPAQVKGKQATAKLAESRRLAGLRKLVADPEGREWLWDLLAFCGISRSSFTGNSQTFFNEGMRNVGLKIQGDLTRHQPDAYVQMMREHAEAVDG